MEKSLKTFWNLLLLLTFVMVTTENASSNDAFVATVSAGCSPDLSGIATTSVVSSRFEEMMNILRRQEEKEGKVAKDGDCLAVIENGSNNITLDPQDVIFLEYNDLVEKTELGVLLNTNSQKKENGEIVVILDDQQVIDAVAKGLLQKEDIPGGAMMKFMYNRGFMGTAVRAVINRKALTSIYGFLKNKNASERDVLDFLKNILKLNVGTCNLQQINREFKELYGKGLDEFTTINEIFARLYLPQYMQKMLKDNGAKDTDIVSNSTARIRFYEGIKDLDRNFNLTDKNISGDVNSFNVRKLFGNDEEDDFAITSGRLKEVLNAFHNKLKITTNPKKQAAIKARIQTLYEKILLHGLTNTVVGSTMVVNRLAPIDYHNFHFPVSKGTILSREILAQRLSSKMEKLAINDNVKYLYTEAISFFTKKGAFAPSDPETDPAIHLDGKYLSVSTIATTSKALKYNPLVENVRDLLFIENEEIGIIPYVIIGATGVGANVIKVKSGQALKMGDEVGHFEFGGSTVVMFIPEDKVESYPLIKKSQNIFYDVPNDGIKGNLREMEVHIPVATPIFYLKKGK